MAWTARARGIAAAAVGNAVDEVGLHTEDPTNTGGTGEVSGNGYSRASISGTWASTTGVAENPAVIQFALPTGSWGTITHYTLWDSSNNLLDYGALSSSITVNTGDDVQINAGDLDLTVPAS